MLYPLQNNTELILENIVLDLNGTIAIGWKIVEWVAERIKTLQSLGFRILLCSGDQRGNGQKIADELGIEFFSANDAAAKKTIWKMLDGEKSIAIGNARIDIGLFENAQISILTLQDEWVHVWALAHADILIPSINNALDLFIDRDRFIATMKI